MTVIIGKAGLSIPVTGLIAITETSMGTQISAIIDPDKADFASTAERDAAFKALVWCASRYPTPEEPIIPIVLTGDQDSFSAFFADVSVTISSALPDVFAHQARIDISGRRIGVHPLIEVSNKTTYRNNDHAGPTTISRLARMAFPPDTKDFGAADLSAYAWEDVECADMLDDGTTPSEIVHVSKIVTAFAATDVNYTVNPEHHYRGSSRLEQQLGGGTEWVQVPGLDIEHLPDATRLNNARMVVALTSDGGFTVSAWDPGANAMCTAQKFLVTSPDLALVSTAWNTSKPSHNRPELVVLSCTLAVAGFTSVRSTVNVDFELRRGDAMVGILIRCDQSAQWQLSASPAEAADALASDYGIIADTDDGAGNKWMIGTTDSGATFDLVGGSLHSVATTAATFGVGISTHASTAPLDPTTMIREFFGVRMETDRVTER